MALPDDVPRSSLSLEGYTGPLGSRERALRSWVDEQGRARFETTRPLDEYDGLTIVASFAKGFVHEPTAEERRARFLRDNRMIVIGIGGLGVVLFYYAVAWLLVGRDPARGTIIPLFEPPLGLRPACLRYVRRMGYDQRCFAAAWVPAALVRRQFVATPGHAGVRRVVRIVALGRGGVFVDRAGVEQRQRRRRVVGRRRRRVDRPLRLNQVDKNCPICSIRPLAMGAPVTQVAERAREATGERTRVRILDGAVRAIARHGITKLGMSDVSESAGVSRGTLYRYFPSRDELLEHLAEHESRRFRERVDQALRSAPPGESRLEVALRCVAGYAREHPAIRRLVETEPAFVLGYVRERFPALCAMCHELFAPVLGETEPVQVGAVTAEQMVDWLTRVMISAVLLPDPAPDEMARGLTAVYRLLADPGNGRPARKSLRKGRKPR